MIILPLCHHVLAKPLSVFESRELVTLEAEDLPEVVGSDEKLVDVLVVLVDVVDLRQVEVDVETVGGFERRGRVAHLLRKC